MPLAQTIQNQLTENFNNKIVKYINLNINMTIQIIIIKNWYLYKSLFQLAKNLPSFKNKKTHSGASSKSLGLSQKKLYQIFAFKHCYFVTFKLSRFSINLCIIDFIIANLADSTVFIDKYRICC